MRPTEVSALQAVLAAEHAVVFGYGVAGARLTGAARRRAVRLLDRHSVRRDELSARLTDAGAEPEQAAPAYALPQPLASAQDARALATLLEERLAATWADALAGLRGDLARLAVDGLAEAAVEAALWRGGSVAFPGLPER